MDEESVLYHGTDADGDEMQIIGLDGGEVILRVRNHEDDTSCGVILDRQMMTEIISTLVTTVTLLYLIDPAGGETRQ
jgi:hypothetical protein